MSEAVFLKITSWVGVSLGATHYYGKLNGAKMSVALDRRLTAIQAGALNRKHGRGSSYKAGQLYTGFSSRNHVIKLARQTWKEFFPDAGVLVLGSRACADPQQILEGPSELKAKVNELYAQAESIGFYDGGQQYLMQEISDEFWELWKEYR